MVSRTLIQVREHSPQCFNFRLLRRPQNPSSSFGQVVTGKDPSHYSTREKGFSLPHLLRRLEDRLVLLLSQELENLKPEFCMIVTVI